MQAQDPVHDWAVSGGASAASLAGDALSEVLDQLRIDGWYAGASRLAHPFGVEVPVGGGRLFIVLEGRVLIGTPGSTPPLTLRAGEMALVLHGSNFTVRTAEGVPVRPVHEVIPPRQARQHQGIMHEGEPAAVHLAAAIRMGGPHDGRVRFALPGILVTRWDEGGSCPMTPCVRWLHHHGSASETTAGFRACVNRYLALLVVESIRRYLSAEPPRHGYLHAVGDPQIGPVLGLMRARLAYDWSVEQLALESGMSRSSFCNRFHALVGESPGAHLRALRIEAAADLLRCTARQAGEIGREVGYQSDTAFGVAFKRVMGMTPGEWRARGTTP
jgi:AraC-like DNA-binding protein